MSECTWVCLCVLVGVSASVLGTSFYVMEYVAGRIFPDPLCVSVSVCLGVCMSVNVPGCTCGCVC